MTDINIERERQITTILAHNRTENIGQDVWSQFVVPRYYDRNSFFDEMPCLIQGGRGCGKTMLLRFLSYKSQYSIDRKISNPSFDNIGIYWRADTAFLRQLDKRGLIKEEWLSCFIHYVALKLLSEVVDSIIYLNERFGLFEKSQKLPSLSDYTEVFDCPIIDLKKGIEKQRRAFEIAVNNPRRLEDLLKFPLRLVNDAIEDIRGNIPLLSSSLFHIFVDEYENLLSYQQVYVNTCIKHSEPPLIYKIACKRNGMPIKDTLGDEAIQEIHDYIVHDLDAYTKNNDYNVFAAEVLLNRISNVENQNLKSLNEIDNLQERKTEKYKAEIIRTVKTMFPGLSQSQLATQVFETGSLRKKLEDLIKQALSRKDRSDINPARFIDGDIKEASIVCSALLNRNSTDPDKLIKELNKYKESKTGKFSEWINTNFVGCYLNIIKRRRQENRLYCGFDSFISLSNGNLRHFLELARTAFSLGYEYTEGRFNVSTIEQSIAAEKASSSLFSEIKSFRPMGNKLHIFAHRLGTIFSLYQSRLSQSEPEIGHFSIDGGDSALNQDIRNFLYECEKWGVLYKTSATKTKQNNAVDDYDWVLNPIYAPQFLISYRKKRKITLSPDIVSVLFDDTSGNFDSYLKRVKDKVGQTEDLDMPLDQLKQRDFFDV